MKIIIHPRYMKTTKHILVLWMSIICLCAFGQQSLNDSISGQVPELMEEGSGWDFGNWRENIILGVITSLLASLILWIISIIWRKLHTLEKMEAKIEEAINNEEDPYKVEKKIEKLEKEYSKSDKITEEEKATNTLKIDELRRRNSISLLKIGCKKLHKKPPDLQGAMN